MNYPTTEEVESADRYALCKWHRFLPSPENKEEEKLSARLFERWGDAGGFTPEISKSLGWEQ